MPEMQIRGRGFSHEESQELAEALAEVPGVKAVHAPNALPPGAIQATVAHLSLMIILAENLAKDTALGVGAAASAHAYKKVGEGVVDATWEWLKRTFHGGSDEEVSVEILDEYGKPIRRLSGRR